MVMEEGERESYYILIYGFNLHQPPHPESQGDGRASMGCDLHRLCWVAGSQRDSQANGFRKKKSLAPALWCTVYGAWRLPDPRGELRTAQTCFPGVALLKGS